MKKPILLFIILFTVLFTSTSSFSQETEKGKTLKLEFKVDGVCEMCKNVIENAAYVKGVKMASWDKMSGNMTVVYRPDKTNEDAIHQNIAKAGYDTEKLKATDEDYAKLPNCCKYRDGLDKH